MKHPNPQSIRAVIVGMLFAGLVFGSISCGSGYAAPTAPAQTSTPTPTGANVTVSIIGSSGSGAFSPNPAAATVGQTIAFKNNDSTLHHIVSNAGGFDSGNIAPGATSSTMTVSSGSAQNFHCTVHPTMVFAVNGSAPPPDPVPNPTGGYDYN